MDLKKHLDRAEQALHRGQADFSAELCDQVLDFAPGEARAAELLAKSLLQLGGKKSLLGKLGAGPAGFAAGFSKITKNPDAEARARRRAFIKDPGDIRKGCSWAEALERAGYAGAALGAFGALSESDVMAAKQAGALAHAQGEVELALEYYQRALDVDPRDTDALRARKNLAAEQALRTKRYDEADSALDLLVEMDKPTEGEE
ncbi:MAG TPA: hypothetical protein QGG59_05820 [Planctomycetota bacterium]|jgi:tetratricopeptide (TPR) repeat protein|nr:hypothetical protein [Planctomycetota bacterium]MDP7559651.1 hypothetical protein [Planctomycetota bacterium]HJM39614.1 hypothetical protein [Planctomycetota bacterium]|tara:strand:- start:6406 stop:7014 length:609 start_codon:yes stop_codon:yes gene_type:complete